MMHEPHTLAERKKISSSLRKFHKRNPKLNKLWHSVLKGKKRSKDVISKISFGVKAQWADTIKRKRIMTGIQKSIPRKVAFMKDRWKNDSGFRERASNPKVEFPTDWEKRVIQICKENGFNFKYTGNKKQDTGRLRPDFVSQDNPTAVIEVYGNYKGKRRSNYPRWRRYHLRKVGYTHVLFLTEMVRAGWKARSTNQIRRFIEKIKG